jgi:ankyrin repeat protein
MTYKSNNSAKKRRLSSLEQFRKRSVKNVMMPLSEHEKKSILYLYYLDIDLDNNLQESITMENNDKDGFLELLRGNLNKTEAQDLLINKFITIYIKKNGTRNKALIYNKKNSIKNNSVINKGLSLTIKNKSPLFKNNFFSRNEIKRSSYKIDKQKKKKSVLEYNLLFDPSLTGYNNLITDTDIVFDPNNQKTIINKRKIKEIQRLKNKQLTSFFISSGGMKTDKNLIVMKTLDLKNQYNHKNKGNINSLTSSIKDCNYDSFVKFYRTCKCGPNAKDKEGNSLLSLAVKSSCLEIVDFLLEEKANPNLQNVSKYYIYLFFIYEL